MAIGPAARVVRVTLAAAVALFMATGCAGGHGRRDHAAALTVARRHALAAAYLAIAEPANHRLEIAVNGFNRRWRHDPAAADAFLRAQAATERWFDRRLARIPFPPAVASIARAMIAANQHRIALTDLESRSVTVAQLGSFGSGHRAADAAVEVQVRRIRHALGLPPPSDS